MEVNGQYYALSAIIPGKEILNPQARRQLGHQSPSGPLSLLPGHQPQLLGYLANSLTTKPTDISRLIL
jgi:hypothetical protein